MKPFTELLQLVLTDEYQSANINDKTLELTKNLLPIEKVLVSIITASEKGNGTIKKYISKETGLTRNEVTKYAKILRGQNIIQVVTFINEDRQGYAGKGYVVDSVDTGTKYDFQKLYNYI